MENLKRGKNIVLGYEGTYGMDVDFITNLESLGFNVIPISLCRSYKYKNIFQHIVAFINRKYFKNTEIEKELRLEPSLPLFYQSINKIEGKIDFTLIIRPDSFPKSFIKKIKNKSNLIVAYQWDGLQLFYDAPKRIKYFDRFFVFDPKDLDYNPKLLPTTNFYFDYPRKFAEPVRKKSIYFLGTFINFRMKIIADFTMLIKKLDYFPEIYIVAHQRDNIDLFLDSGIVFLKEGISYQKNYENVAKSDILVDFENGKHNGLSFRIFDAIGLGKKIITTNPDVYKYDFFHPNNFFVLKDSNINALQEFLTKPYVIPPERIKLKYSFTNWIHYVLNIGNHQTINLPKTNS